MAMGLLKTVLSPRSSSKYEKELRSELRVVKAQLAEAKVTIADLQQGAALREEQIGTAVSPEPPAAVAKTSVAVQAKPPVELESRIPRAHASSEDGGSSPLHPHGGGGHALLPPLAGGPLTVHVGGPRTASPCSSGPSSPCGPAAQGLRARPGAAAAAAAASPAASRSRIPAAASSAVARPRGQQARAPAPASRGPATGPPRRQVGARQQTPSEAGAGALAASSRAAHAELLTSQLRVAEAFRQGVEAELRAARHDNIALQSQVLGLQTRLERALGEQVHELERLEAMRRRRAGRQQQAGPRGGGAARSSGGGGGVSASDEELEQALRQLSHLQDRLADSESARIVAEQQAQVATELATDSKQQLHAMHVEATSLRQELGAAQAKVLELTAECASQQQQLLKLRGARARLEALEALEAQLAEAQKAARCAAQQHERAAAKLHEELATQRAITDTTNEELLQLNAAHSQLKEAFHKLKSESRQHDEVVAIVQHELQEMSFYAAAGRVALGLCAPEDAPMVSGSVVVTPALAAPTSPGPAGAATEQPAAPPAAEAQQPLAAAGGEGAAAQADGDAAAQQPPAHGAPGSDGAAAAQGQPALQAAGAVAAAADTAAPAQPQPQPAPAPRERRKKRRLRRRKGLEVMGPIFEAAEEDGDEEEAEDEEAGEEEEEEEAAGGEQAAPQELGRGQTGDGPWEAEPEAPSDKEACEGADADIDE